MSFTPCNYRNAVKFSVIFNILKLNIFVIAQPIITCYDNSIVLNMSPFTSLIYVHITAATIQHVQKSCYQKVLERP